MNHLKQTPLLIYNFLISTMFAFANFLGASSPTDYLVSLLFLPLSFYFLIHALHNLLQFPKETTTATPVKTISTRPHPTIVKPKPTQEVVDVDRRAFLRLIATAGMSLFFMAIFTRKAQAAFFGSVPGPGTVALKDTAGNKIDPAEKQPTDGYEITELDDDDAPAYYGFVKKTGAWYIMREDATGSYRYAKGPSDFATGWTNRTSLTYDYFYVVFG